MDKPYYTGRAREDILDIWLYIAPRNSETVADRVLDRIHETCGLLARHPKLGRIRPEIAGEARSITVQRWLTLYRLAEDGVQIVRIIDGARDLNMIEWAAD